MVEWKVRLYRDGDEEGIVNLLSSQLAPDARVKISPRSNAISMSSWIWNFKNNPYGFLIAVSERKEQIVGYLGLFCFNMKIGDRIIKGSQGSRLYVHPDFRRQGMFLEIGKTLLTAAGEKGIPFSIAIDPNEPAYHGHLQYGWFDACRFPVMTTYFDISNTLKKRNTLLSSLFSRAINYHYSRKRKGKIPSEDLNIKKIGRFDKRIDDFWNRVANDHRMMIVKDSTYLNWRYFDNPNVAYETFIAEKQGRIEGYLVTNKLQDETANVGWIIDALSSSRSVFLTLIHHAVEHLKDYSVDSIKCLIAKNKYEYKWMQNSGFTSYPRPKITVIARINSPEISLESYNEASKDWYMTYGDSDFM